MSTNSRTLAFVSSSSTQEIAVLAFDRAAGQLTEIGRYAIPGEGGPSPGSLPIVLSRDRRRLYAALRQEPFLIISFEVSPEDGALTPLGGVPIAERPAELLTDRTDRFLFSVSYSGHILSVGPIERAGVALPATQIIRAPQQTHGVVIDPTNRDVYIACMAGDVLGFRFDATVGRLDETPFVHCRSAEGAGPRHLALSPDGRHLYVITEHHGTVITYARDTGSGMLTELQIVSMLPDQIMQADFVPVPRPPPGASDIRISPDGRFVVSTDRITNSMASFRVDGAGGRLVPVGNFPGELVPRSIAIDSAGRDLLCIGVGSGTVGVYGIDETSGALSKRSSIKVGDIVDWVEIADFP